MASTMFSVFDTLLRETRDELGRNPEVVAYMRVVIRREVEPLEKELGVAQKMEERYRKLTEQAHQKMLNAEWEQTSDAAVCRTSFTTYYDFYTELQKKNLILSQKVQKLKRVIDSEDLITPLADYIVRWVHDVEKLPDRAPHGVISFLLRPITDLIDEIGFGISSRAR